MDDADHRIAERDQVRVGGGERPVEALERLIGQRAHVADARRDRRVHLAPGGTGADEQEHDALEVPHSPGRLEQRGQGVRLRVVAAVQEDQLAVQALLAAERVFVAGRRAARIVVRPRRQDGEAVADVRLALETFGHEAIERHHAPRSAQRGAVQHLERAHREAGRLHLPEGDRLIGVDVHHPETDRRPAQRRDAERGQRRHRRGRAHQHPGQPAGEDPAHEGLEQERRRAGEARQHRALAEGSQGEAPNLDAVPPLARGVAPARIAVTARGSEHHHPAAAPPQLGRHVGQVLADARRIRHVDLAQDEDCGGWHLSSGAPGALQVGAAERMRSISLRPASERGRRRAPPAWYCFSIHA